MSNTLIHNTDKSTRFSEVTLLSIPLVLFLIISFFSGYFLYNKAVEDKKEDILDKVYVLSSLISNIAAFDNKYSKEKDFSYRIEKAMLSQIIATFSDKNLKREYLLAKFIDDKIVFQAYSKSKPKDIKKAETHLAIPMRKALKGDKGVIIESDYAGKKVFAAYAKVKDTPWGLVIKQPYAEYIKPLLIEFSIIMFFLFSFLLGILLFLRNIKQHQIKLEIKTKQAIKDKEEIKRKTRDNLKNQEIMQQQSKMAQMGEMIGAIAHQWRQPLSSISGEIQNLELDCEDGLLNKPEYVEAFIGNQMATIKFMSKTIDDFRSFFRVDKDKRDFKVLAATQSVINMLSAQLKDHNISLIINGDEFEYTGLKSEYQQVILNVINNAKDVLIENKIESPTIIITLADKKITIKDNAGGVPKDIIDRVFEPYFTTKEQGKGTGMGLYMSKMIIEDNMGGVLKVSNNEDGAIFVVDLN